MKRIVSFFLRLLGLSKSKNAEKKSAVSKKGSQKKHTCVRRSKEVLDNGFFGALLPGDVPTGIGRHIYREVNGDIFELKYCIDCGRFEPLDQFHVNNIAEDKLRCSCKKCSNARSRENERKNRVAALRAENLELARRINVLTA